MNETRTIQPAPVRKTIEVAADPAKAFRVFTSRIAAWWPRSHHIGAVPVADVVLEPGEGGRWYERGEDGSECQWGRVLVWDPPERLVLAWQITGGWTFDPNFVTEIELRFTALGGGRTRVELEHRNLERFGDAAQPMRAEFNSERGWSGILGLFAEVTEKSD